MADPNNRFGISITPRSILSILVIAGIFAGIVTSWAVNAYRINQLEDALDDLELYVEGIDDYSDEIKIAIVKMQIDIKHIREKLDALSP